MEQSMMDSSSQPTFVDDSDKAKVKRKKKDPSEPTGKNVVVLIRNDVTRSNGTVFMPNTIEMAQIKKPEKGQFKTGIQISRNMTEAHIERILEETFPFLGHLRFFCAAAVDNRTRLDFHGEPRIWDGHFIKKTIKGNSALYIFAEEEKSGDSQGSRLLAQSTPKRSHDQITTQENEKSEQPSKKKPGCEGAMTVPAGDAVCPVAISTTTSGQQNFYIPEVSTVAQQSGVSSVTNIVSQEMVSSMLSPEMNKLNISNASSITAEQSDQHSQQTSAGLQHVVGNKGSCHSKNPCDEKNHSGVAQGEEKRACVNNATARHQEVRGAPVSDHEGEMEGQVASNSSTSDSGYDGETHMSFNGSFETAKPEDSLLASCDHPDYPQVEGMQDVSITPDLEQAVLKALHNGSSSDSALERERDSFSSATKHIFCDLQKLQDASSTITSKTNPSESLNKIALSQGFIISDHQGSGNCMFHALSEQLATVKGMEVSHEDLRQCTVQYLKMNPRLPNGTELFNFVHGYPSWADYLRNMSADGMWGDHLILFAAANCFGTSIHVVSSLSHDFDVTISPECGDDSSNMLMLGYLNQNHYVSLQPIPEVERFTPKKGSLEGGYEFTVVLYEELPEDVTSGIAEFEGVKSVGLQKLNSFTFSGIVPGALLAGDVNVTVKDQTGTKCIAKAVFCYVDDMWEMVVQLVEDREKQAVFFAKLSQGYGLLACICNNTQVQGPWNQQHQGQTKQEPLDVLLQMVYVAAERGAQQFIEMIFSTSAGQVVFNSCKDRTPLPEAVARANGHEDLAQYLHEVNTRLSKEISSDVTSCAIDWLELVEAVQKQAFCESDDNSSDYFADAETSCCGSFDLNYEYQCYLEDKETINKECQQLSQPPHLAPKFTGHKKECEEIVSHTTSLSTESLCISGDAGCGKTTVVSAVACVLQNNESIDKEPCSSDGMSKQGPDKRLFTCKEDPSNNFPVEKLQSADNKEGKGLSRWQHALVNSTWLNKEAKWEEFFSRAYGRLLNKEDETDSSILNSSPSIVYVSGLFDKDDISSEADVHVESEIRTAKPKVNTWKLLKEEEEKRNIGRRRSGRRRKRKKRTSQQSNEVEEVITTLEFVSERNPYPKDTFVNDNNRSKPHAKNLHMACAWMTNQRFEDLQIESECVHRTFPCTFGSVHGSAALNKELPLGDLPMADACMEELQRERLRLWLTKDVEAGNLPATEPCTIDGMSQQGPNKRPFTCKEDPSNNFPVEKMESADNKEDKGVSRWGPSYSVSKRLDKLQEREVHSLVLQGAPFDKKCKTESSILKNSPGIGYFSGLLFKGSASGEADVHSLSETETISPKVQPHVKDLALEEEDVDCPCMEDQHFEDLRSERSYMHGTDIDESCTCEMVSACGSSVLNEELPLRDPLMMDACAKILWREHLIREVGYVSFVELQRKVLKKLSSVCRGECEGLSQPPPLPPVAPYFTGCEKECEEIVSHVTSQSTRTGSIFGRPGCGKSSIAIAVAHDLQSRGLPVYYLSLQGLTSKSELTSNLLSFVRHSSSKNHTNKDLSIDEQVLEHFSKVSENCVVILDNADDVLELSNAKEEILLFLERILVQNSNVKLTVTTREHLELADLHLQDHHSVLLQPPRVTLAMKSEALAEKWKNSLHPKKSSLDLIAFPENDDDGEIISFPDLLPNNLCDIDSTVNNNSSHTTAKTTQSLSVYHHAVVRSINTSKGDLGYHLKLREPLPEIFEDRDIISFFPDLLPKNLNDNDNVLNDNSSHTTFRAIRSFLVFQPAFEGSVNTSNGKDNAYYLSRRERDFIVQHGQNVDDAHMIRFLHDLFPKNINDNDNSSHTTTRATRSFSICQPAFERSFITNKVKHFLSGPGLHAHCSPLHSLELKATTDLCVLIVDEVTGTLLPNGKEYVLKLLGKVLMSSRNVTLVMASREPPPFGNFCPQRYKATRIGSPEDVPSHTDEVTGTFLPNVKEYVLKLLGNVLMPNRNVTLVMTSRKPPPFGNFCP